FNFEKFQGSDATLTTQMKSVGEVMAVGRTFQESLQKALRGLELGLPGFSGVPSRLKADLAEWRRRLSITSHHRLTDIFGAFEAGITIDEIHELSHIDPWFLDNLHELWCEQKALAQNIRSLGELDKRYLFRLKQLGFSDKQIAQSISATGKAVTEADV